MQEDWFRAAWRRNVIEMHIGDWDERFMSEFNPGTYVEMLKLAKTQSAVLYAPGHAGTCFYPTNVGHTHRGLKGRDIFGGLSPPCPLTVLSSQVTLRARAGAEVLGTLTLPYTDPADTGTLASIHSNPPGNAVGSPNASPLVKLPIRPMACPSIKLGASASVSTQNRILLTREKTYTTRIPASTPP